MNIPTTLTFLGFLFIGLKLTGYIAWSWFWVIFPLILQPACIVIMLLLFLFVSFFEADWNFTKGIDNFIDTLKMYLDD
jgi:hypothetical protein